MEGAQTGMTVLNTLFTAFSGWMGDIVSTMTTAGNELMLIPVGLFVVG